MVDMQLIIYSLIGAGILAAIALIGSNMSAIVSIVSRVHERMTEEGAARRAYRQRVYDHEHMSSQKLSRTLFPIDGNSRSYAAEPTSEPDGTPSPFPVPTLWEQLGTLSDDELLDILARVQDANGIPKFADSRIAKFVGGRVEDRVAQVRDVRGSAPPPPKPPALLRVRDNGIERLIAKYGK